MSVASLQIPKAEREKLWQKAIEVIEQYIEELPSRPVKALEPTPEEVKEILKDVDFNHPIDRLAALDFVLEQSWKYQLHTSHPRYFGLFDPTPTPVGIAAETIASALNAQLGVWSSAAFANEVERLCSRNFAAKFGYPAETSRGTFTYGGTEANLSALLMAITTKFPDFIDGGLRSLSKQPLLYVSSESHHSFLKAARMIGLGRSGVREIPVDQNLRMDIAVLERTIARDKQEGAEPFFIVGTVGTTKSGVIDDLQTISSVAARHDLWFHVDAAWGGAIAIVPEYRYLLDGIEKSDSITFDPHKWLSVPLSAGLILTRHADALQRAFRIPADYLPWSPETDGGDPYTHSLEWSRRFTGLKVFLSLWTIGWEGFADVIRHQIKLGQSLRLSLTAAGWLILNETPLPTVCFTQPNCRGNRPFAEGMVREILQSGRAWISVAHLSRPGGGTEPALRACICSHRTDETDVAALVEQLDVARTVSSQR